MVVALALLCWFTGPSTAVGAGVVTASALSSGSTVYLSGVVSGLTSSTRAYFEYGTDLNYGSFTSSQYFNPPGSQNVYITVNGMAPGTYHYRIMAIDSAGVATGNDLTFTINGPVATTLPANVISSSSVILNGFVTPIGAATKVYFQYGQTTDYTNQTAITNLSAGATSYLVTNKLSGLTGNPFTLYYRIVASNSLGVTIGTNVMVSMQAPVLTAYPQAVFWNAGNTNPPTIQLAGAGAAPLTYTLMRSPQFGTIVTNLAGGIYTTNTGKCQYLPNMPATFSGQDSFTFTVSNGANTSAEATVSISVLSTNINHAPHAQTQSIKVLTNTPYNGYLTGDDDADALDPHADLTNYADPNHKGYHYSPVIPNLTYTILSNPSHGTLVATPPFFMYTPTNNYLGTDSFTFKVNDGALDSTNVGTVSIVVATNVGAIRPGFDKFSFGRADDQSFPVSLTGTNSDWLGRDLLLQFSNNKFPTNYFTQFYANNNGNLTFKSANPNYIGTAFPTTTNGPMLAPYWADVYTMDTRSGVMTYGMQYIGGRLAVGVTWTNVMTYQNTTNTNSFQVILIDRSDVQVGNFDVEFNYEKIQWLNGTASLGTYPSVGFDRGDGLNYYNFPGSGTANLVDTSPNGLIHNSNVSPPVPGRYSFQMYQPTAWNQSIIGLANTITPVTLSSFPGVLGTNYSFTVIAGPTNGTLSGSGPNRTYQPNIYSCLDAFTYTMSDGTRNFTNTVTITVVGWPSIMGAQAAIGTNNSVTFASQIGRYFGDTTAYVRYGATTNYGSLAMLEDIFPEGSMDLYECSLETNRGAALSFNGGNQYVKVPATISNDFTIEFWFLYPRVTSLMEGQWYQGLGLVDGYVPGATGDFGVSVGNGKVLFGVGGPDTTISSGQLLDGNWHHVAATRVQTNGAMALYIDGVLTASTNGSTATLNGATNLTFGCLATLTNFFPGSLDEVRLWNVARTPSQIQQNMNRSLSGTNSGLVACYHLDDWPGTNAVDASGNGKTGNILNNPDWTTGNIQNGFLDTGMYHFELVALNQAGPSSSGDLTFGIGTNATLSSLTVNPGSLIPSFSPSIFSYVSTVANSVSNADYVAVTKDPHALLQVQTNGGAFSAPVSSMISNRVTLNFGANLIPIQITSPNRQNTQTYTLNVLRLLSDDATLSSVTASGTVLTFNVGTYSGQFPTAASNTTLTATANNPYATLELDGVPLTSGVPSGLIPLPFGNSSHVLAVTAQSGFATVVYPVNFTRSLNTNANLANLACSSGGLNPPFSSSVTGYSLAVPNSVGSLTVTPTCSDSVYATVQVRVNGGSYSPVSSEASSGALGLNVGTNTISILVAAQDGTSSKIYTLTVTRQAGLPVVTTQPASTITVASALLNASVNPNGTVTVYSFQYGSDTNYTKSTVATSIGGGTNSLSVSNLIAGLLPGTTNHFRVVASNSFGLVMGADMSFTNLADVPVVTNATADSIAHSTVSLHGAVNPNGAVTIAYFQYGQSTNYDSSTSVTNLGGGTTLWSFDSGLSNLLAGKTYHYQLVATNSVGTNSSGDMTFTLLAPPQATGFGQQGNGSFQLQFSGGAGLSYTLQTSTDLTNWMNLTNLLAGTNGLFIFNDATATNSPIRFYRLTQP